MGSKVNPFRLQTEHPRRPQLPIEPTSIGLARVLSPCIASPDACTPGLQTELSCSPPSRESPPVAAIRLDLHSSKPHSTWGSRWPNHTAPAHLCHLSVHLHYSA